MGRAAIFLTKTQFADQQGWSPSYVTELAKTGRLVLNEKGRVNVQASLARIRETAAGTHPHVAERHASARGKTAPGGGPESGKEEGIPTPPTSEDGRLAVRKYRELITGEDRKIDLGLLKGDLLHRAEADHLWHDMGVAIRAGIEAAMERLAPRLAASTDAKIIAKEIGETLRDERRKVKRLLISALRQARMAP